MSKDVIVMGSFVVDLMMRAERLPAEGETIKGKVFRMGAGGKGSNQAQAALKAGADTLIVTKVGNDYFGEIALDAFKANNMDTRFIIRDSEHETGAALIMVDDNRGLNKIIVTLGACDHITDQDIESVRDEIEKSKVFLTQLETNLSAVTKAIDIAYNAGVMVILNPAPAESFYDYHKLDYITPNETEAEYLSGIKINSIDDAIKASKFFLRKGVKNCIITLGEKGALLSNADKVELFSPFKVNVVDTTGAGDAFNGALAAALSEGKAIRDAIKFANAAASLSVTKIGTSNALPSRAEIDSLLDLY